MLPKNYDVIRRIIMKGIHWNDFGQLILDPEVIEKLRTHYAEEDVSAIRPTSDGD